ncbi:dTDP-4-amino-4,6-dideoxygalactose transaminase [Halomonas sp. PR-M31]|uniref:dTDP-4-amino-4,6-dideoxygalactose transaminase n=1 Tax=Halomonas sp. PR-M31 TaxID=1471202 RepID=UPI000650742C|nr:dTDP-4-amino-4,6-dideoxygalactose transaminase [Halomonas sp. PR-M31]
MIPFNKPSYTGREDDFVLDAMRSSKISGGGAYASYCQQWFEEHLGCYKSLLTPSCTHALEMTAMLINIRPGDEVIMPSYTFVSTANAFVLRGAKIVFVDIHPATMNIDERLIEAAITQKTKAVVVVHYAGVACEMDSIMTLADRYGLFVIEDAAQAMLSTYKGKPLGCIGHLGTYSFHETKNYTSGGEGGLLIVNDERFAERAEVLREKGTNRSQFFRGMVDKYSWVDVGSSYLPSELQAAYLWGQLQSVDGIDADRRRSWEYYNESLEPLAERGVVQLPTIPDTCRHNVHMFYIKVRDIDERSELLAFLKEKGIGAVFHYVPLHTSQGGKHWGTFVGEDEYTTQESDRLLRLPLWYGIDEKDLSRVVTAVKEYFA